MTDTKELIQEIKRVRAEEGLSYSDIQHRMEENGDIPLSPATLSRIFADDSENNRSFSYDMTLIPLARAVLNTETIEIDDNDNVKALKEMLKLKHARIKELEQQLEQIELVHKNEILDKIEAFDKERTAWGRSIEFLKEQVTLKDKRMDEQKSRNDDFWNTVKAKDARIEQLSTELMKMMDIKETILSCPCRQAKITEVES